MKITSESTAMSNTFNMFPHFFKTFSASVILIFFVFLMTFTSFGTRTIDKPWINLSNTSIIDIDKVELTDSATVLTIKATSFRPKYWLTIASGTHLVADGKEYPMTKAEGIVPDIEFWMPESGRVEFRLFFEPIPLSTKRFDFIEGNEKGAFKLLDIDITGNEIAEYPEGVPEGLKKKVKDVAVPDPAFEMGKTTINFHLCPYNPELGSDFSVWVETMSFAQEEYPLKFDENGNATLSFDQYGSAKASVEGPNHTVFGTIFLYPGESIDCYLDARQSASNAMRHNRAIPSGIYKKSLHTGKYSDYDRAIADAANLNKYWLPIGDRVIDFHAVDYHMTGEEYKNRVKELYQTLSHSIENADISQGEKEYCMLQLQNDVLYAIIEHRRILEQMYRFAQGVTTPTVPIDSVPARLSENDYEEVAGWFDISNPKLLMTDLGFGNIGSKPGLLVWSIEGGPGELPESLDIYGKMERKAKQMTLSDEDMAELKSLSNPFFAYACDSIAKRTAREYIQLQNNAHVMPTPEVADDKVFDAIIAPYKGKVVIVDLWNTWCAPCRAAIKHNEPLKTGELANDDIVWIYIADESSDPMKYLEMIQDIKGIHFKVNAEQIDAIRERFNVDGIPYYILVDREGNAEGRPDIRDHNLYIREIKSKLKQ